MFFLRWGRKFTLIGNNIFVILGAILEFLPYYTGFYVLIIVGRFFIGINSGINAGVCAMYLCEIAPMSIRGLVSFFFK